AQRAGTCVHHVRKGADHARVPAGRVRKDGGERTERSFGNQVSGGDDGGCDGTRVDLANAGRNRKQQDASGGTARHQLENASQQVERIRRRSRRNGVETQNAAAAADKTHASDDGAGAARHGGRVWSIRGATSPATPA